MKKLIPDFKLDVATHEIHDEALTSATWKCEEIADLINDEFREAVEGLYRVSKLTPEAGRCCTPIVNALNDIVIVVDRHRKTIGTIDTFELDDLGVEEEDE